MAQLALGALGAWAGAATLGTGVVALGMTGTAIGWAVGSSIGAMYDNRQKASSGPRLDNFAVQGTDYGQTIPWVAGSPRIAGQIVWASNKREIATTTKSGKGGGSKSTSYTYEVDLLILLTENEIEDISRVWLNNELVWGNGVTKSGVWNRITSYSGLSDQLPDPTYEAAVGTANAVAYRARGSVFIQGLQLGQSGQIPNLTFEVGNSYSINECSQIELVGPISSVFVAATGVVKHNHANRTFTRYRDYGVTITAGVATATVGFTEFNADTFQQLSNEYFVTASIPTAGVSISFFNTLIIKGTTDIIGINRGANQAISFTGNELSEVITGYFTTKAEAFYYNGQIFIESLVNIGGSNQAVFLCCSKTAILETHPLGQYGFSYQFSKLQYDDITDKLYLTGYTSSNGNLHIIRVENFNINNVIWSVTLNSSISYTEIISGRLKITRSTGSGPATVVSLYKLTEQGVFLCDVVNFGNNLGLFTPFVARDRFYFNNNLYKFRDIEEYYGSQITGAISEIFGRCEYDESEYLFTAEDSIIKGLTISQVSPTRNTLELLQSAYLFDVNTSDKIYIKPKNNTVRATINFSELGSDGQEPLKFQLVNELEVPSSVSVSYYNELADKQVGTELSDRILSAQENLNKVSLPLVFNPTEAKRIADIMVKDQMNAQLKTTISLPMKYSYLEPNDVILVVDDNSKIFRLRIVKREDDSSTLRFECVSDNPNLLETSGVTDSSYSQQQVKLLSETQWYTLDIPLLRQVDNTAGFYICCRPVDTTKSWSGARAFNAFDTVNYERLTDFSTADAATAGVCVTTLGNFTQGNVFDETNVLRVNVLGYELESRTRAEILNSNSLNAAVVGNELIQFREATLISEGVYDLRGLLRGRLGTERTMSTHVANERFVMLANGLQKINTNLAEIQQQRNIKVVTYDLSLDNTTAEQFTDTATILKPYTVASLRALETDEGFSLSWIRRTRFGYRYVGTSGISVPLGEASESYRVRFLNNSGGLLREVVLNTSNFVYTKAMQTADGLANSNQVTAVVTQLSEIARDGFATQIQFNANN